MKLQTMPLNFRVWDTTTNKFLENDELLDFSHGFINSYDEEMIMSGGRDFIISQDTGLKDKNGTSIYTGDIVKCDDVVGAVEYHNGYLGLRTAPHELPMVTWISRDMMNDAETIEIVGNIWQNPELVEEK